MSSISKPMSQKELEDKTIAKLLPYQVPHLLQMHECLKIRNRVVDASDTGTGKTYAAVAVCKMLKLKPFVICPKSVISSWKNVCKYFDIQIFGISNYEMLRNGNYYTDTYESVKCPYMDKDVKRISKEGKKLMKQKIKIMDKMRASESHVERYTLEKKLEDIISKISIEEEKCLTKNDAVKNKLEKVYTYHFYLPPDTLVIVDEAHRCKNKESQSSQIMIALHKNNVKIMLLSATLTDKIDCFKPFGILFGFYSTVDDYRLWMKSKVKELEKTNIKFEKDVKDEEDDEKVIDNKMKLKVIHNNIFPQFGSRMKICELGDMFPKNNITATPYYLDNHEEIDKIYNDINDCIEKLKKKEDDAQCILAVLLRARQRIEMLKIPIMLELVEEGFDNKYSVVIFVNFLETMEYLVKYFRETLKYDKISLVLGGQGIQERDQNIADFQDNTNKIMIAMIQAGNVGISLHDIHGGHPRMSVISPSWSGQDTKQALGRIHRAGSKSPAIQKLVYVADTYEEQVAGLVHEKIRNIGAINDGNFVVKDIKTEQFEEIEKYEKEHAYDKKTDNNKVKEKVEKKVEPKVKKEKNNNGSDSDKNSDDSDDDIIIINKKEKKKNYVKVNKADKKKIFDK